MWHKRLGHSSKIVIQNLANDATGVQITHQEDAADELTTELCKPCHLSNVENQISRCPHVRSQIPFERLHADITHGPTQCYNNEHKHHNVLILPTPDPTPEPTGPDVDINTHPAAIDDCTWNIASRAHNISANFDEDNIIEGCRTRNHRAAHLMAVANAKVNSFQMINEAFSHSHSHSDFYKSQNLFPNTVFTVINNTSTSTASIPSRIHRSQLSDPPNHWADVEKHPHREESENARLHLYVRGLLPLLK
ncbi:uncharacterized protein BDCG_17572 [Blastomyces dermatitidis ER-3]|uniref:GAG-pre-integrase domain-containing protein n=1 Tax=Ajellomyces dermatitidis (strain ER-3 / ATCC MYA-2586) TaxID=559297 RepID=A0ABX2VZ91_AJEDR|nr:uncharacterized protein BDCG_17572 [Blastomyces dermatitidis ER-3]OAT02458.1 hypothetical protein BDCG_17572 [Blastomyces dermatitidis ER-3]